MSLANLFPELAQVILESIGDGVVAIDADGRVTYMNPVAERLSGWSQAEALGRPLDEVLRLIEEASGQVLERRDGRRYAVESTRAPIRDGEGAVIIFQDVSDRRLLGLQLAHQSTHDALTGLFNRQAFDGHLQRALDETRVHGTHHALGYLDLDQFKVINDTCGHLAGDELLCRVTSLLQDCMRETDLVARLGGDELAVLMPRLPLAEAEAQVSRFHQALQDFRFVWREKSFNIGASIGLVPITSAIQTVAQLLSAADHACYVAKEKGRNRIQVYQEDDAAFIHRQDEMNWVVRIQETLEQNRFCLFSQAIQPLSRTASRGIYFEVLLRMVEEGGRIHLPSDFIRAAERYGLMRSIDRWVVRESLRALKSQPPPFLDLLHLCSINLSGASLGDEGFLDYLEEELDGSGVPAGKICLEITETAAIANFSQAERLLVRLAGRGVRFALDDFGSGLASYSYLKDLPVSVLKIDGRFIKDMVTDPLDLAMVESINQVGHVMGLVTVAEGISSGAAVERLRSLGVDYAQGHWISPPRPLADSCGVASRR